MFTVKAFSGDHIQGYSARSYSFTHYTTPKTVCGVDGTVSHEQSETGVISFQQYDGTVTELYLGDTPRAVARVVVDNMDGNRVEDLCK